MPAYDLAPAVAYAAAHRRDPGREIIALVCDPKQPPRMDAVAPMQRIDNPALMKIVDSGIVDWPLEGRRCPVIVVEQPRGRRVFPSLDEPETPLLEELVTRICLQQSSYVLRDMASHGVVHRAIRPDNLFFDDEAGNRMVFGQCLSAPIAVTQPVVYETIEAGLSAPAGRGEGGLADDLYAVGVTTLALLIGHSPCFGMSDDEILRRKMAVGSYTALVGSKRVSLTMMEPLRGLLNDNPIDRWGLEDLVYWINGRRLSPRPQTLPQKGGRAFEIGETGFMTGRDLAQGMSQNWDESVEYVRNGSIATWIRRSIGDDDMADAVTQAASTEAVGSDNDDRLVARTCIALHPSAPVRYRDFRALIDGFGSLLAAFSDSPDAHELFATIMRINLVPYWFECQNRPRPELMRSASDYEKLKPLLERTGVGFGVERAIYDLNPNQPCLSPMLEREYVISADDLMPALERVAQQQKGEARQYVDRHVGAFVAARFRISVNSELQDMDNRTDQYIPIVAAARLLSSIQENQPTRIFPALSQELAKALEPATNRFHSRRQRKRVRDELRRVAKSGRIFELLNAVDNQAMLSADARSFQVAVTEYAYSVRGQEQLDYERQNRSSLSALTGAQVSSVISGFVTTIVTLVIALVWLF